MCGDPGETGELSHVMAVQRKHVRGCLSYFKFLLAFSYTAVVETDSSSNRQVLDQNTRNEKEMVNKWFALPFTRNPGSDGNANSYSTIGHTHHHNNYKEYFYY